MKVESSRFGTLEVPDDRVILFPEGFPGFAGKRFALIDEKKAPLVWWLQSLEEPATAVLIVDRSKVPITYDAMPKPAEIRAIQPDGPTEAIACRVIVRAGDKPGELCFNLFAPLFINLARRLAMQVPLVGSGFGVREYWPRRPEEPVKPDAHEHSEPSHPAR